MEHTEHPLFALGGKLNFFLGATIAQSFASLYWWDQILRESQVKSVLEVGTGTGSLTVLFGLHCPGNVKTLNIKDQRNSKTKDLHARLGIEQFIADVFSSPASVFGLPRPILVVCDNGNKHEEFLKYTKLLEPGDWIAVHDYRIEFDPKRADIAQVITGLGLEPWRGQAGLDRDRTRIGAWRCRERDANTENGGHGKRHTKLVIGLVCNHHDPPSQRGSYDRIWSIYMREELLALGMEAKLIPVSGDTAADHAILTIGSRSRPPIATAHQAEQRSGKLWQLFDSWRCCVPWPDSPSAENFIGLGVDPKYCHYDPGNLVLFQPWVGWPPSHKTNNPYYAAADLLDRMGYNVQILPAHCREYLPWVDICRLYRSCRVFLDATPVPFELGRLEVAACGAGLVYPSPEQEFGHNFRHYKTDMDALATQTSTTGLDTNEVVRAVVNLYEQSTSSRRKERAARVASRFTWAGVASRLVGILGQ